jgi:hypothetical protein
MGCASYRGLSPSACGGQALAIYAPLSGESRMEPLGNDNIAGVNARPDQIIGLL